MRTERSYLYAQDKIEISKLEGSIARQIRTFLFFSVLFIIDYNRVIEVFYLNEVNQIRDFSRKNLMFLLHCEYF